MVEVASRSNLINGFKPAGGATIVSHLQFVDDTLIFCEIEDNQVLNVKTIFLCFEPMSGLKVNFFKSELLGVRINSNRLQELVDLMGCKASLFPASYPGQSLSFVKVAKSLWNPVTERIEKYLAPWKAKYLYYTWDGALH